MTAVFVHGMQKRWYHDLGTGPPLNPGGTVSTSQYTQRPPCSQ